MVALVRWRGSCPVNAHLQPKPTEEEVASLFGDKHTHRTESPRTHPAPCSQQRGASQNPQPPPPPPAPMPHGIDEDMKIGGVA